jgi:hypothetical protein
MPLVEEESLHTDRRGRKTGLWLVASGGVVLVWAVGALIVALFRHSADRVVANLAPALPPLASMGPFTDPNLQGAASRYAAHDLPAAAALIGGVAANSQMTALEKHAYFRIGAESMSVTGQPAAAARYYERFLAMSGDIKRKECRGCHGNPGGLQQAPISFATAKFSRTGGQWIQELRNANQLQAAHARLKKQSAKTPSDPATRVLLYHLESEQGNNAAAQRHLAVLEELDRNPQKRKRK